jgi:hypothetical protein
MIALAPVGVAMILLVLWDAFETVVLPRRVDRRVRPARWFYRTFWHAWRFGTGKLSGARRESLLAVFGPLSVLMLFVFWASLLILGFSLVQASAGSGLMVGGHEANFGTAVYLSGTTFFTLGLGDVAPTTGLARAVTVIEAGTGFSYLALVIGYLPILYQTFSRRELNVTLLDARAGSPPSAGEMLRRYGASADGAPGEGAAELERLLLDWERWAAELLESHVSYPIVAYFRSQHDHQSWLGALTAMLDFSALILACERDNRLRRPAELAFAMSRHAVVDLMQTFRLELHDPEPDRLTRDDVARLDPLLDAAGMSRVGDGEAWGRLSALRVMYEPYASAIALFFLIDLPGWLPEGRRADNWQTSDRGSVLPEGW